MRHSVKLAMAAVAASLLLVTMIGPASARNLSISTESIRVTWSRLEFEGGGVTISCPVTLEGSFHHKTIPKIAGSLMGAGFNVRSNQANCVNGIIAPFNGVERYNGTTTPSTVWHQAYRRFIGVLPNINVFGLRILRFRFGIRDSVGFCTGQYGNETDAIDIDVAREAGGSLTEATIVEASTVATLTMRDGGFACLATATAGGTGSFMVRGSTLKPRLTLI